MYDKWDVGGLYAFTIQSKKISKPLLKRTELLDPRFVIQTLQKRTPDPAYVRRYATCVCLLLSDAMCFRDHVILIYIRKQTQCSPLLQKARRTALLLSVRAPHRLTSKVAASL